MASILSKFVETIPLGKNPRELIIINNIAVGFATVANLKQITISIPNIALIAFNFANPTSFCCFKSIIVSIPSNISKNDNPSDTDCATTINHSIAQIINKTLIVIAVTDSKNCYLYLWQ